MAPTLPTGRCPDSAQRGVDGLVATPAIGDEQWPDAEVGRVMHRGVDQSLTSIEVRVPVTRSVTCFDVHDAASASTTQTRTINVSAVNDAPTVTASASISTSRSGVMRPLTSTIVAAGLMSANTAPW